MAKQEWIKAALKERGHKLKDVAEVLKVTPPRVSDIIKGTREVQADEIIPLSELLGLTPTALLKSLEKGTIVSGAGHEHKTHLLVEGQLTGTGRILPLPADFPFKQVAVPPDAEKADGLRCFIMGDDSLAQEIKQGSLIIAADPREHFFPIVPGTVLLIQNEEGDLLPRQYHRTPDGKDWLVSCPTIANPAFESFPFDALAKPGTRPQSASVLNIGNISAAVLWVHRRYT